MKFLIAYATDKGIKKQENQDSFLAVMAHTPLGLAAFVVLCDGMGGLAKGELASAQVVRAFADWFERDFPTLCQTPISPAELQRQWVDQIAGLNGQILNYGKKNKVSLGTTATGLLLLGKQYYGFHVGDSCAFQITQTLCKLTKDQTLVQRDLDEKRIPWEQAQVDPRKHILLQCIGASSTVQPQFLEGKIPADAVFMLCSDGFVHKVSEEEIRQVFTPEEMIDQKAMEDAARYMVEQNMKRQETDNITVVLIRSKWEEEEK